ncbi:hypothetical protein Hrubri_4259 [Herbaspirillum rubrisubalbicans M1]|uniref:hypothetical protein n=1 Tax=Herbaspirillum rubrisubalbicans TaxID=80842 RepID=UPI00073A6270|nr:hypothetical protein [Herbaspirillum rubrisubalbicans]ALU91405.1 hypothetical protein Hrubri_4259 [Herbaspirillum rubrisubalbicans M1]
MAYLLYAVVFLIVLWFANDIVRQMGLPTYGAWTGNVPLENKIKLLREFAANGPIDAVVMGSSSADQGFSAQTFSAEMSHRLGRPVRVFNMATGAGDWQMFPILYQLTRLYAAPKQLYILHSVNTGTGNDHLAPNTPWPDGQFMHSSAGRFLKRPTLHKISAALWLSSLINDGGAARDLFLYGIYRNAPSSSLLNYPASAYGDKISHMFMHDPKDFNSYRATLERTVIKSAALLLDQSTPHDCTSSNPFFSKDDLSAIAELRMLLSRDGVKLTAVAHDTPAAYSLQSPEFERAKKIYYEQAIKECLKPDELVYPVAFIPQRYETEDIQHINVHGARRIASQVAANIQGNTLPVSTPRAFLTQKIYPTTIDFHHLVGVIFSGSASQRTISIDYYTFNVMPVDQATMRRKANLQLELIDDQGTVHVGRAIESDGKRISFAFADSLPQNDNAFIARLVENLPDGNRHHLIVPIQSYTWTR